MAAQRENADGSPNVSMWHGVIDEQGCAIAKISVTEALFRIIDDKVVHSEVWVDESAGVRLIVSNSYYIGHKKADNKYDLPFKVFINNVSQVLTNTQPQPKSEPESHTQVQEHFFTITRHDPISTYFSELNVLSALPDLVKADKNMVFRNVRLGQTLKMIIDNGRLIKFVFGIDQYNSAVFTLIGQEYQVEYVCTKKTECRYR